MTTTEDQSKRHLDMCKCEKNEAATSPHPCPYAQEISGSNRECTCCRECTHECAMDI